MCETLANSRLHRVLRLKIFVNVSSGEKFVGGEILIL